jgi:hypothetical protein
MSSKHDSVTFIAGGIFLTIFFLISSQVVSDFVDRELFLIAFCVL